MVPRWVVVDKMVHELGALRAVVQEVEAQDDLAEDDVAVQLRSSLARAADTIHLVIGGNEGMVAQAWRTIAEAQVVGARARVAIERSRAAGEDTRKIRDRAKAESRQTAAHVEDLRGLRETTLSRSRGEDEEASAAKPGPVRVRPRAR
jgi:hypothetical protein